MRRLLLTLALALFASAWSQSSTELRLVPLTVGNVFLEGEDVRIGLETEAESVAWTLHDLWGEEVSSGEGAGDELALELPEGARGYFRLTVTTADGEGARAETTLAVLAERDFAGAESPFAVQTHFAHFLEGQAPQWDEAAGEYAAPGVSNYPLELVELLTWAGVTTVRDELPWNRIEPAPGVYAFAGMYEDYMRALEEAGLTTLTILNYGNRLYDVDNEGIGAIPFTDEGRAAYAAYGAALVRQYPEVIRGVEVWNEPNAGGAPWNRGPCRNTPPQPNPDNVRCYAELVQAVHEAIKAEHPEVRVVGPATSGLPFGWLELLFKEGALEHLDAVSVHPYRPADPPEGLGGQLDQLAELIGRYGTAGSYISELGWATTQGEDGTPERSQAQYLVRAYTQTLAAGVERFFWYDFMNDGADPTRVEQNWGLVRHTDDPLGAHTPKPSYIAFAVMARELTGASFMERDDAPEDVYSYAFAGDEGDVRVMWASSPVTVLLQADAPLTVTDMTGLGAEYAPLGGSVTLTLGEDPVYVRGSSSGLSQAPAMSLEVIDSELGEEVAARFTVEHNGPEALELELLVGAESYPLSVAAGGREVLELTLPGRQRAGLNTVVAEVAVSGVPVARLSGDFTARDPLELASVRGSIVAVEENDVALRLSVLNASERNAFTVTGVSWSLADASGEETVARELAPGASEVLELPLPPLAYFERHQPLTVRVNVAGRAPLDYRGEASFSPVVRLAREHQGHVDDLVDDLDEVLSMRLPEHGTVAGSGHGGEEDLSAQVWFLWDEAGLSLVARVRDDVFEQPFTGGDIYEGDSVMFSVAPSEGPETYGYGMALTAEGPQLHRRIGQETGLIDNPELTITQDGDITLYELTLPWEEIPAIRPEDGTARAAVQINDNDGQGRKGWLEWGAGIGRNTPSTWREVQFVD